MSAYSVVCTCDMCGLEVATKVTGPMQVNVKGINGQAPKGWIAIESRQYGHTPQPLLLTGTFCTFTCTAAWFARRAQEVSL